VVDKRRLVGNGRYSRQVTTSQILTSISVLVGSKLPGQAAATLIEAHRDGEEPRPETEPNLVATAVCR